MDVGSGGGFPGLVLACVWRETRVVLVEARERKAGFLEQAVRELGLSNVRVVCARLEACGAHWSEPLADAVFIRGVGDLPAVLDAARPVAQPEAGWVYFLGHGAEDARIIRDLGSRVRDARVVSGTFAGRLLVGRFAET
jgi:16S rRNA (guanine527-N7)-methyltransferase